jgi:hypothetical protein
VNINFPFLEVAALPEKVKTPIVSQVNKAGVAGEIVCSAEDREAQLCQ